MLDQTNECFRYFEGFFLFYGVGELQQPRWKALNSKATA